jgi:hypothetical protein
MSEISLRNQHLLIASALAAEVFGGSAQAFVHYDKAEGRLLLAPMQHPRFSQMHKSALQMLKSRNLQGDKSLSLQEVLIDHELDDSPRDLDFSYDPESGVLSVLL